MQLNTRINIIKANLDNKCPHGMAPGTCPSCSGIGGGGSKSIKKSNEMSWDECYSIGQAIQNAKKNNELDKIAFQNNQNLFLMENKFAAQRQIPILNFIQNRLITPVLNFLQPIRLVLNKLLDQPIAIMNNLMNQVQNKIKEMLEKFPNIADKLAAIFGEEENSLKDKISKNLNKLKKKVLNLIEMINGEMEQGETEEFDEKATEVLAKFELNKEPHDDTISRIQQ